MAWKRYTAEQIIGKLREVALAQGDPVAKVARRQRYYVCSVSPSRCTYVGDRWTEGPLPSEQTRFRHRVRRHRIRGSAFRPKH